MEKFACVDLGMKDCKFSASGSSKTEVRDKAVAHARVSHPELFKGKNAAQLNDVTHTVEMAIKHTA